MAVLTLASGVINTSDHEYTLAGVTLRAYLPAGFPDLPGAALSEPLEIGRAISNADGAFEILLDEQGHGAAYSCYLTHCDASGITLRSYDVDGTLLVEIPLTPLPQLQAIQISLLPNDASPAAADIQQMGTLMQQAQLMTLQALATELTQLAPLALFREWSVQQRIAMLRGLESALLDPDNLLAQIGMPLRISQLQNSEMRLALREQVAAMAIDGVTQAFDNAVLRADMIGGHLQVAELPMHIEGFLQADIRGAVTRYVGNVDRVHRPGTDFLDVFPWLRSPLAGYRDYLVDIWVKRATQQLREGLLDANGALQQLNNRFHQNFRTTDTSERPANRLLCDILSQILQAPAGMGFGFGLAAAIIQPPGERTDGQYLDYLISLTGETRHELENRYRLNLSRSDFDVSSPVQQNIETLQRFFTDSFQCDFDPHAIFPPLTGNGLPIINEYTYPGQAHGPFFWQYEEWQERNEPFYAENYFDIRKTYHVRMYDEESQKAVWGRTMSLAQFLRLRMDHYDSTQFIPPKTASPTTFGQEQKIGDQWSRNLVDLQEQLAAAHQDFYAGFYSEAERRYAELTKIVHQLQIHVNRWKGTAWDHYNASAMAAEQRSFKISDPDSLDAFENKYALIMGYWLKGNTGDSWFSYAGSIARVPYFIDLLLHRLLPACLAETRLALGKYREAIQGAAQPIAYGFFGPSAYETSLAVVAQFGVYSGPTPVEPGAKATPPESVWWATSRANTGSLAFATDTTVAMQEKLKQATALFPANAMEKAYFRLKLGDALLEWADQLYRTDQPSNIQRARELYKGVLFLHGEDPEISPAWNAFLGWLPLPFGVTKLTRNPRLTTQISRAHIGFEQINASLNYYGFPKDYVPPVRYRVLREAALSFAASAKSTQNDYINYMSQYERALLDEMTARNMVEKASYAVQVANEQVQIAQFSVGEAKKQVEGVKAQIAAKQKEIKDSESFFSQLGDFFSGMKDAAKGLGQSVLGSMSSEGETAGGSIDYAAMYKVISSKGGTSAATAGLTGGMAVMAGYGAFVYAGVTSMQSLEAAGNKRMGELKALQEMALPAAEKMVVLKQREVKIAELHRAIAQADYNFGQKMLAFYDYRFLSKAFWQQMSAFANRLMRRYLDLGGRTAWFAERALSFETDKDIRVVSFDYFPRQLRGVTGADTLQLHLAELEATRIFGLSQTIPVKQTLSLARDFPIAYGQLKKQGSCWFSTAEIMLRLAYPGLYGYRIRCVSLGVTYTHDVMPHKGMLTNHGVSVVSRSDGSLHRLARFPDALPLSEFNMRGDMLVYDLPDETLLPFEGSGIDTAWQLSLCQLGDAISLETLTDVLLTFDMRASYSATLAARHQSEMPVSQKRAVLMSGKAQNPGALANFRTNGGVLALEFNPIAAVNNSREKARVVTFLALTLSGVDTGPIVANLQAMTDGVSAPVDFIEGVALSNAGFLAAANGGVALSLNALTGISADQRFVLTLDADAHPGVDFSDTVDVQLLIEYEAQL